VLLVICDMHNQLLACSPHCCATVIMGPSFLEGGPIMYRSCPSVHLSRAYFFLRIILGT